MKKIILLALLTIHLLANPADQTLANEQAPADGRTLTEKLLLKPSSPLSDEELRQRVL